MSMDEYGCNLYIHKTVRVSVAYLRASKGID